MEPFIKLPASDQPKTPERWKASRYNLQATDDDGSLFLSNTMTGAFLNIPAGLVLTVKDILRNGWEGTPDGLSKQLADRGFLVSSHVNELFRARLLHEVAGRKSDTLQLIFLTTEQCNFRCVYCYETFEKGKIQPEVRQGVKQYVRNQARFLKNLNVSWFGGEPLLALDVIEELTEEFLQSCAEYDIHYNAHITTNGYLLTPDNAEKLLALNVNSFQITVDGTAENHDQKRKLLGGQGTFDTIWRNLIALQQRPEKYHCHLRVNFDRTNLDTIPDFLPLLHRQFADDPRFSVNFFPVGQWGGPQDDELPVLSHQEAIHSMFSLCEQAYNHDLTHDLHRALKPGGYVCYAAKPNSFVIGSDGTVYKCTVALYNDNNRVGQLLPDGTMRLDMDKYALWVMNDESEDPGCKSCFFRPSCQGASCPLVRIEQGVAPCPPEKKHIQTVVKLVGKQMKKAALSRR